MDKIDAPVWKKMGAYIFLKFLLLTKIVEVKKWGLSGKELLITINGPSWFRKLFRHSLMIQYLIITRQNN